MSFKTLKSSKGFWVCANIFQLALVSLREKGWERKHYVAFTTLPQHMLVGDFNLDFSRVYDDNYCNRHYVILKISYLKKCI